MTKTPTKSLRVKIEKTKLGTYHNGEDLIFIHPSYGLGTYAEVKDLIEKDGLETPTMAQLSCLIHAAYNSEDMISKEIKNVMGKGWLWAFTGTLYVPEKGAYIQDYPTIKDGMPYMDESELIKKLESNDPDVRFVPFGYKTGEMSSNELRKNAYVIGLVGEESAEKLAEVSGEFKHNPHLYCYDSAKKPFTRISILSTCWGLYNGLDIVGNGRGFGGGSGSYGVQKKN